VTGCIAQPLFVSGPDATPSQPLPALTLPFSLSTGITLIVSLVTSEGTLWCYAAMAEAWRSSGIDQNSASLIQSGPYGKMRHPDLLVPDRHAGWCRVAASHSSILGKSSARHIFCASIKASDQEQHLAGLHGAGYTAYSGTDAGRALAQVVVGLATRAAHPDDPPPQCPSPRSCNSWPISVRINSVNSSYDGGPGQGGDRRPS